MIYVDDFSNYTSNAQNQKYKKKSKLLKIDSRLMGPWQLWLWRREWKGIWLSDNYSTMWRLVLIGQMLVT